MRAEGRQAPFWKSWEIYRADISTDFYFFESRIKFDYLGIFMYLCTYFLFNINLSYFIIIKYLIFKFCYSEFHDKPSKNYP